MNPHLLLDQVVLPNDDRSRLSDNLRGEGVRRGRRKREKQEKEREEEGRGSRRESEGKIII